MTTYGGETERMDFYTEGRNVLLFKFPCKMSLDKRGLEVMSVTAGILMLQKGILLVASMIANLL